MAYSEDGISWTELQPSQTGSSENSRCMAVKKQGYIVALGKDIKYSSDGKDWSMLTNPTGGEITGAAYGNGRFIGVSSYVNYIGSSNGTQWFQRSYHGVNGTLKK